MFSKYAMRARNRNSNQYKKWCSWGAHKMEENSTAKPNAIMIFGRLKIHSKWFVYRSILCCFHIQFDISNIWLWRFIWLDEKKNCTNVSRVILYLAIYTQFFQWIQTFIDFVWNFVSFNSIESAIGSTQSTNKQQQWFCTRSMKRIWCDGAKWLRLLMHSSNEVNLIKTIYSLDLDHRILCA